MAVIYYRLLNTSITFFASKILQNLGFKKKNEVLGEALLLKPSWWYAQFEQLMLPARPACTEMYFSDAVTQVCVVGWKQNELSFLRELLFIYKYFSSHSYSETAK